MNRLIIVGNGFDLAHGMKTKYHDFVFDYIKTAFEKVNKTGEFKDQLMFIRKSVTTSEVDLRDFQTVRHFGSYMKKIEVREEQKIDITYIERQFNTNQQPFVWFIYTDFIYHLFTSCIDDTWVNIENEYYSKLLQIIRAADKRKDIRQLNDSFSFLISILTNYISRQKANSDFTYKTNPFYGLLQQPIDYSKFVSLSDGEKRGLSSQIEQGRLKKVGQNRIIPSTTLILNFNYTTTIENYLYNDSLLSYLGYTSDLNYIHGKPDTEIIFGFGDEVDEKYILLERENNNEFLQHIKSFGYFKNHNYSNLIRFIESNKFEVFIWGHSCGLSDRTMLNMIFEEENCKSIKIFHHKISDTKNNYTELTQEISRHFKNKAIMRKKIVPFDKLDFLPQVL